MYVLVYIQVGGRLLGRRSCVRRAGVQVQQRRLQARKGARRRQTYMVFINFRRQLLRGRQRLKNRGGGGEVGAEID